MPRVMRACRPEHTPSDEWGQECRVQWGASGVVFSEKGNYRTAYFEAFPASGSGFIRGEGPTVAEAEEAALVKRRRELACPEHRTGRRKYLNGVGFCLRCGACFSSAFKPIVRLGTAKRPPSPFFVSLCLEGEPVPLSREERLRLGRFGLRYPDVDGGEDAVGEAMREAAEAWALTDGPERLFAALDAVPESRGTASVFDSMENIGLRRAVEEVRAAAGMTATGVPVSR